MIWFVVAAIAAAAGTAAAAHYWNKMALIVTDWLKQRGLYRGLVERAVVRFDNAMAAVNSIRRRIFVTTAARGTEIVDDSYLSVDEIADPKVREQVRRQTQVDVDIMKQL